MKKLKILNSCIACGLCEDICPQVFVVCEKSKIKKKSNLEEHIKNIKIALKMCPKQAILEYEQ